MKAIDETGNKYGRLRVIGRFKNNRYGNARWLCLCVCNKMVIVFGSGLRNGNTKSCGCLRDERNTKRLTTHGLTKTVEYKTWNSMIQRCFNKDDAGYNNYGGRNITVCIRWLKFENFFADMGIKPEGLTIERIDNNRDYCKENCKWATWTEQGRNQRIRKDNKTGVNGVSWSKRHQKYCVRIRVNGKRLFLGHFDSLQRAAKVRKQGEQRYWNKQ